MSAGYMACEQLLEEEHSMNILTPCIVKYFGEKKKILQIIPHRAKSSTYKQISSCIFLYLGHQGPKITLDL